MLLKVVLLCVILNFGYSTKKSANKEVFEATNEWKEIREGQKVPSGLHYRIDLSTGKKEAKINDKDDSQTSKTHSFVVVNQHDSIETKSFNQDISVPKDEIKKIATKYRSIEELKKELGELNLNSKTDAEIIFELFSEFEKIGDKRELNKKRILNILEDLIYLSHQIDNANEFVRLGGFTKIIFKNLNATDENIIKETLKLFSSLVQNNSKVKIHALESDAISKLLKILNINSSPSVQYSTVTSLSCLLRTFPFAQASFVELGGISIFSEIFVTGNTKIKLKIVTLIDDLLNERQNDPNNFKGHKVINLKEILHDLQWCNNLIKLLNEISLIDINDHDSMEKCLTAMNSLKDTCREVYSREILINLNNRYEILANQTIDRDDALFYKSLGELSLALIGNNDNVQNGAKDEL